MAHQHQNKRITKIAGVLILLGIIAGIFSIVPQVESEHFMELVYPNRNKVLSGTVFQFLLVPIYIGFSLLLFSIISTYDKTISIGFIGFRFMAGTFQLIGIILLPIIVGISQEYLDSSHADTYATSGELLRYFRDLTNHLGVILATGLGNFLLYILLFKEKLIPNWLSIWGFLGNLIIMLASFLIVFRTIEVVSPVYVFMSMPLVIQEIVLAIWLLTKGFTTKQLEDK